MNYVDKNKLVVAINEEIEQLGFDFELASFNEDYRIHSKIMLLKSWIERIESNEFDVG